jgi:hypothetical protein
MIKVQGQPRKIVLKTPFPKITTAKWTGGVVEVVEHLLCKYEAMSPNPQNPCPTKNQTKPKKKKKNKGIFP